VDLKKVDAISLPPLDGSELSPQKTPSQLSPMEAKEDWYWLIFFQQAQDEVVEFLFSYQSQNHHPLRMSQNKIDH
jgi:hypothetical protein